jgi:hypothetical protein
MAGVKTIKGWNSIEIERRSKYPLRDQDHVKLVKSVGAGACVQRSSNFESDEYVLITLLSS